MVLCVLHSLSSDMRSGWMYEGESALMHTDTLSKMLISSFAALKTGARAREVYLETTVVIKLMRDGFGHPAYLV